MAEAKDNAKWERLRAYANSQRDECQESQRIAPVDKQYTHLIQSITWGVMLEEMDRLDAEAKAEGKAVK